MKPLRSEISANFLAPEPPSPPSPRKDTERRTVFMVSPSGTFAFVINWRNQIYLKTKHTVKANERDVHYGRKSSKQDGVLIFRN
ncbi:hypothetical protein PoB_000171400 [Plakobranchus ocellatus]|uniref:Uncharacterized protein n=1 Tax=Plakobranchus ocellatus TaxID=259542 RepID=A0AAV3XWG0_9GAST|nr:hypothetical protein PoB_000171400 [Plakobranchus ocellatus]